MPENEAGRTRSRARPPRGRASSGSSAGRGRWGTRSTSPAKSPASGLLARGGSASGAPRRSADGRASSDRARRSSRRRRCARRAGRGPKPSEAAPDQFLSPRVVLAEVREDGGAVVEAGGVLRPWCAAAPGSGRSGGRRPCSGRGPRRPSPSCTEETRGHPLPDVPQSEGSLPAPADVLGCQLVPRPRSRRPTARGNVQVRPSSDHHHASARTGRSRCQSARETPRSSR